MRLADAEVWSEAEKNSHWVIYTRYSEAPLIVSVDETEKIARNIAEKALDQLRLQHGLGYDWRLTGPNFVCLRPFPGPKQCQPIYRNNSKSPVPFGCYCIEYEHGTPRGS